MNDRKCNGWGPTSKAREAKGRGGKKGGEERGREIYVPAYRARHKK